MSSTKKIKKFKKGIDKSAKMWYLIITKDKEMRYLKMFEQLCEMLRTLETVGGVSVDFDEFDLDVTFEDFHGFDDDWNEIMRDYEMPELVDEVFDLLHQCDHEGDFYVTYFVEGHRVEVGFGSYDI